MATRVLNESFTGTGVGSWQVVNGNFMAALSGFGSATVALQVSPDGGTTVYTIESYTSDQVKLGFALENLNPSYGNFSYRFNCTAYTSGTIVAQVWI